MFISKWRHQRAATELTIVSVRTARTGQYQRDGGGDERAENKISFFSVNIVCVYLYNNNSVPEHEPNPNI